jgi:hypothetical protein
VRDGGGFEAMSVSETTLDSSREWEKSVVSRGSSGTNAEVTEVGACSRSELEQYVAALTLDVENLKDEVRNLQTQLNSSSQAYLDMAAEIEERIRRYRNLIVFNYFKSNDETPVSLYNAMASMLGIFDIPTTKLVVAKRLGRNMVCCPVLLVFKSAKYVRFIIKNKIKLTSYLRWMSVRVCVDLTPIQRYNMKCNHQYRCLSPNLDQQRQYDNSDE